MMPNITKEWLEEQQALCEKATAGPWTARQEDNWVVEGPDPRDYIAVASAVYPECVIGLDRDDANLIAAARTGYPALLQWALEAQERERRLREALAWALERLSRAGPYHSFGDSKWHCRSCDAIPQFQNSDLEHSAKCHWAQAKDLLAEKEKP